MAKKNKKIGFIIFPIHVVIPDGFKLKNVTKAKKTNEKIKKATRKPVNWCQPLKKNTC